jgi:dodecin
MPPLRRLISLSRHFPERWLCGTALRGNLPKGGNMSEHVYKKIEIVGSSSGSFEEAVNNAVLVAAQTIRNMRWFEVVETRGQIEDNKIAHWQVTLKVGFKLEKNP